MFAVVLIAFFNLLLFLATWAQFKCMFTDPGVIPFGYRDIPMRHLPDEVQCALEQVRRKFNIVKREGQAPIEADKISSPFKIEEEEGKEGEETQSVTDTAPEEEKLVHDIEMTCVLEY